MTACTHTTLKRLFLKWQSSLIADVIKPESCEDGDIHLSGNSSNKGIVEICRRNVWGTVCTNNQVTVDALVMCRMLGYHNVGGLINNIILISFASSYILCCSNVKQWLLLSIYIFIETIYSTVTTLQHPVMYYRFYCQPSHYNLSDCVRPSGVHVNLVSSSCTSRNVLEIQCACETYNIRLIMIYFISCPTYSARSM